MAARRRTRRSPRRRTDASGAWIRDGSLWRFYLDPQITYDGRWRVRGQFRSPASGAAECLLRVLDTIGGEWSTADVATSGRRYIAEASDVGLGWEDAIAEWENVDEGDEGSRASDPEADMRDLRRWETEAERAPWIDWVEASGRLVLLVAGFGVVSDSTTDEGRFRSGLLRAHGLGFVAYPFRGDGSIAAAQRTLALWQRRSEVEVWGAFVALVVE